MKPDVAHRPAARARVALAFTKATSLKLSLAQCLPGGMAVALAFTEATSLKQLLVKVFVVLLPGRTRLHGGDFVEAR